MERVFDWRRNLGWVRKILWYIFYFGINGFGFCIRSVIEVLVNVVMCGVF